MGRDFPPKGGSREGKGEKREKEDGMQGLGSIARLARGSEERSSKVKGRSLDPPIRAQVTHRVAKSVYLLQTFEDRISQSHISDSSIMFQTQKIDWKRILDLFLRMSLDLLYSFDLNKDEKQLTHFHFVLFTCGTDFIRVKINLG